MAELTVATGGEGAGVARAAGTARAAQKGPGAGFLAWPRAARWAPLAPFGVWMGVFLCAPIAVVCVGAFERSGSGGFTLANVGAATSGTYLLGFENSLKLSLIEAVVPAVFGTLLAYAVHTSRGAVLRRVVVTISGVFSQFGGVPLAFLFIAAIGSQTALASNWLRDVGVHLYGNGVTI